jgi:hopanoid biosynthesis associated protein HpnK
VRRLIINADDFGLTSGVNHGILEAHQKGIVTSATLMVDGRAFDEAVRFAKTEPRLGVGCHVVLVDGKPLLPASQVSSLIGKTSATGVRFQSRVGAFAVRALSNRFDPEQIEAEASAQFHKLQSAGIAVTHFDTHKHTHLFPAVLQPLLRAAQACGVRALRNPFVARPLPASVLLTRPGLWKRYAQVKALGVFADGFWRTVRAAGLMTTDGTLGIVVTGTPDEGIFQVIIENLPDGSWELVCHPGYNDAELQSAATRLLQSRVKEMEILTSKKAKEVLERNRIELISFRELVEGNGR